MTLLSVLALVRVPTRDALVLASVVGGIHALAAVLLLRRDRHGPELAAIAGALLAGWVVTEAIVLRSFSLAQLLPLALGAITTGLGLHLATRPLVAPRWRELR